MNVRPDVGLERLIDGLERELLAAPDEEFVAGAQDLGMNPHMKGSAAFIGVKHYMTAQVLRALCMQDAVRPTNAEAAEPDSQRNADA